MIGLSPALEWALELALQTSSQGMHLALVWDLTWKTADPGRAA